MKKVKALIALVAVVTMVAISTAAYAQQNITLGTQVGAETTVDVECWSLDGTPNWGFDSAITSISLLQPSDRSDSGTASDNDPATDTDFTPATTAVYNGLGGDPGGALSPATGNAFGYGDCRFVASTNSTQNWDVQLTGTDFTDGTYSIDDPAGVDTAGYDYILDNGDASNSYPASDEEHGFFVMSESSTFGNVAMDDDGSAYSVVYSTARPYDDRTCSGGSEPCYHGLNSTAHVLYDTDGTGNPGAPQVLTNDAFTTRFGVGVDELTETSTGYSMTATYTLTF
jgi:hypothetical protein